MIRTKYLCIMLFAFSGEISAQKMTGSVFDDKGHSIQKVTVILSDAKDETLNYTFTDKNGKFEIEKPERTTNIVFRCIGYTMKSIPIDDFLMNRNVRLSESPLFLKEIQVKASGIRKYGDTLNYSVSAFQAKQDRTISDVLKRMPGLDIREDGTIIYQGKRINKFYIEGLDLLNGRYSQVSENMQADKVKVVQVLENHQPIKALRDVNYSDHAALNLILKDDTKNILQFLLDIGLGHTIQGGGKSLFEGSFMEMLFSKKMQHIGIIKPHNTGKDIFGEIVDLTQSSDAGIEPTILSTSGVTEIDLDKNYYIDNHSFLLNTNTLWKNNKDTEIRLQGNMLFSRERNRQVIKTTYTNLPEDATILEETETTDDHKEINAECQYKENSDDKYVNNLIHVYGDFDHSWANTIRDVSIMRQDVKPRQYYLKDEFSLIKTRFSRRWGLESYLVLNLLPGKLLIKNTSVEKISQKVLTGKFSGIFTQNIGAFLLKANMGVEMYVGKYNIEYPSYKTDETYHAYNFFCSPTLIYRNSRLRLSSSLPFKLLVRALGNNTKKIEIFPNPQLNGTYDLSAYWQLNIDSKFQWLPLEFYNEWDAYVYLNYMTRYKGNGILDSNFMDVENVSLSYRNISKGLFGVVTLNRSHIGHYQILSNKIVEDGVLEVVSSGKYGSHISYNLSGRISNSIKYGRIRLSLDGSYQYTHYDLLFSNDINKCTQNRYRVGASIKATPTDWFSVDYKTSLTHHTRRGGERVIEKSDYLNQSAKIYLMPNKWQVEIGSEWYINKTPEYCSAFLGNFSVYYKLRNIEYGIEIGNIFGSTEYNKLIFTDYYTQNIHNQLRPREIIFKIKTDW